MRAAQGECDARRTASDPHRHGEPAWPRSIRPCEDRPCRNQAVATGIWREEEPVLRTSSLVSGLSSGAGALASRACLAPSTISDAGRITGIMPNWLRLLKMNPLS